MTRKTEPLSKITNYEYDSSGNKTAEVDALNRRTTYLYDASDRLIKTTFADNTFTEITYDFRNNKLTEKDELGRITKYEYDLAGQLKSKRPAKPGTRNWPVERPSEPESIPRPG
jgi:YD repeat-containing protein